MNVCLHLYYAVQVYGVYEYVCNEYVCYMYRSVNTALKGVFSSLLSTLA